MGCFVSFVRACDGRMLLVAVWELRMFLPESLMLANLMDTFMSQVKMVHTSDSGHCWLFFVLSTGNWRSLETIAISMAPQDGGSSGHQQ